MNRKNLNNFKKDVFWLIFVLLLSGQFTSANSKRIEKPALYASVQNRFGPLNFTVGYLDPRLELFCYQAGLASLLENNTVNKKSGSGKSSRFHLTFETGAFSAQSSSDMMGYLRESGFGDTRYSTAFNWDGGPNFQGITRYPEGDFRKNFLTIKNIKADFSLNRIVDVGFIYSSLGKWSVIGFKSLETTINFMGFLESGGPFLSWELSGHAFFLSAALKFPPDSSNKGYYIDLGTAFGLSKFDSVLYSETPVKKISHKSPCLMTFVGANIFIFRHLSLGLHSEYKYVPVTIKSFRLELPWENGNLIVDFPSKRMNLSGFGYGINVGFHF